VQRLVSAMCLKMIFTVETLAGLGIEKTIGRQQRKIDNVSDNIKSNNAQSPQVSSLSNRATWAAGQPIDELMGMALAKPNIISLAAGFVDNETLPVEMTRHAVADMLAESPAPLQYGTNHGDPELREMLLSDSIAQDNAAAQTHQACQTPLEQVLITPGSNQLLYMVADTLLDPGDIVICAAPSYFVFMGAVKNVGGRTLGVTIDQQGMLPDALEAALQQLDDQGELHQVKAIYTIPYYDNPTGTSLSSKRRQRILEIARKWSKYHKIYIISDEAYRLLRYQGKDIPSIHHWDPHLEHSIITSTFSKSYSPGIRVGWGYIPNELVEPLINHKSNLDFGSPFFTQRIMANVLKRGDWNRHVIRLRENYTIKQQAILQALDKHLGPMGNCHWYQPEGGLCVWLTLPDDIDAGPTGTLLSTTIDAGLLYVPGQYCFPVEGQKVNRSTIRLTFGVQSASSIDQGIAILAKSIANIRT
jgi:2-aminoadipate transaminase